MGYTPELDSIIEVQEEILSESSVEHSSSVAEPPTPNHDLPSPTISVRSAPALLETASFSLLAASSFESGGDEIQQPDCGQDGADNHDGPQDQDQTSDDGANEPSS